MLVKVSSLPTHRINQVHSLRRVPVLFAITHAYFSILFRQKLLERVHYDNLIWCHQICFRRMERAIAGEVLLLCSEQKWAYLQYVCQASIWIFLSFFFNALLGGTVHFNGEKYDCSHFYKIYIIRDLYIRGYVLQIRYTRLCSEPDPLLTLTDECANEQFWRDRYSWIHYHAKRSASAEPYCTIGTWNSLTTVIRFSEMSLLPM